MKTKLVNRIYSIGILIAKKFSAEIPDATMILYGIFDASYRANRYMGYSEMFSFMFAIQAESDILEEITNNSGIDPTNSDDLKERVRILFEYEYWESVDMFVKCALIMFGAEWKFVPVRGG